MAIRILVTGGTFDKDYDMLSGKLTFSETHVPEILRAGRCTVDYTIRTLMLIDSLDMTDADRAIIARNCAECDEEDILITHGTDTITQTARYLAELKLDKTIVLTGAMIPYRFGATDALFNLGSAFAYARTLSPGVYVVMNGNHFRWDRVIKNRQTGFFEDIA